MTTSKRATETPDKERIASTPISQGRGSHLNPLFGFSAGRRGNISVGATPERVNALKANSRSFFRNGCASRQLKRLGSVRNERASRLNDDGVIGMPKQLTQEHDVVRECFYYHSRGFLLNERTLVR